MWFGVWLGLRSGRSGTRRDSHGVLRSRWEALDMLPPVAWTVWSPLPIVLEYVLQLSILGLFGVDEQGEADNDIFASR
nr:hypothetical protein CFP56_10446 [Quercus suber]